MRVLCHSSVTRDMSRAENTKRPDKAAIDRLDYYFIYVRCVDSIDDIDLNLLYGVIFDGIFDLFVQHQHSSNQQGVPQSKS